MPSYQKLRKQHSLKELFFTPELIAEVTMQPVEELGVDAAILFSDITVVACALGLDLEFREGPHISGQLKYKGLGPLEPIREAIELLKSKLKVPLLGFCGGPYTVASYMGGDPALLDPVLEVTLEYIQLQEEAGVDAIQVFDSWASRLDPPSFEKFCLPYLAKILSSTKVPVLLFLKNPGSYIEALASLRPNGLSVDETCCLSSLRKKYPHLVLQGNLSPHLLYEPFPIIRQKTKQLLDAMKGDPGFIVNLGHGVRPDTPMEAVRCLIQTVKQEGKSDGT